MLTETLLVLSRQLHPVRSVDGGPVQHRKRSPAPGTNQIAGFGLTCPLVRFEKINVCSSFNNKTRSKPRSHISDVKRNMARGCAGQTAEGCLRYIKMNLEYTGPLDRLEKVGPTFSR